MKFTVTSVRRASSASFASISSGLMTHGGSLPKCPPTRRRGFVTSSSASLSLSESFPLEELSEPRLDGRELVWLKEASDFRSCSARFERTPERATSLSKMGLLNPWATVALCFPNESFLYSLGVPEARLLSLIFGNTSLPLAHSLPALKDTLSSPHSNINKFIVELESIWSWNSNSSEKLK